MAEENVPGFDSLGFRVERDDSQKLEKLMKSLWVASTSYPSSSGECGAVSDEYLRVWTRISPAGIDHVLEVGGVPGLVGQVEQYIDESLVKAWFWDPTDAEATEPLFPLCFRSPLPWFSSGKEAAQTAAAMSITVLGRDAEFFADREEMAQHPELGRFGSTCVIPTGLFGEEGQSPRPAILVIGTVLLAVTPQNSITGSPFHVLRVRTLGGEVWVALPSEAIEGDVNGKIVAVQGMATGSVPDFLPAPSPETAGGNLSPLKGEDVEKRLRELCVEFSQGDGFDRYIGDIHLGKLELFLCAIFGIFFKNARAMPKTRGKITRRLAERYRAAMKDAPIVMARIVMANTMVLYEGKSSPALVVVAFGEGAEEAMDRAREVLARVHFEGPESEDERKLAAEIEDEDYRFGKRRRLPPWLVGDAEAYAADLWIPGCAAHEDGLRTEVIVCVAEHGIDGLTAALPADLVTRAISRAKGPPPIPRS